jgi:hypothetical protein
MYSNCFSASFFFLKKMNLWITVNPGRGELENRNGESAEKEKHE